MTTKKYTWKIFEGLDEYELKEKGIVVQQIISPTEQGTDTNKFYITFFDWPEFSIFENTISIKQEKNKLIVNIKGTNVFMGIAENAILKNYKNSGIRNNSKNNRIAHIYTLKNPDKKETVIDYKIHDKEIEKFENHYKRKTLYFPKLEVCRLEKIREVFHGNVGEDFDGKTTKELLNYFIGKDENKLLKELAESLGVWHYE